MGEEFGELGANMWTADGKFSRQFYGIFRQEVDDGDLLFIKDVSAEDRGTTLCQSSNVSKHAALMSRPT